MSDEIAAAMSDLEEEKIINLVQAQLDAGGSPMAILGSCQEGMKLVGKRFETGEYFISDLMMAGEIFKQVRAQLGSSIKTDCAGSRGKVVFGTVKGDIHDIGKDLVVGLLKSTNYDVIDLGVDVPPQKFVDAVRETGATVVGLSGLITIAFNSMKETIEAMHAAGLRPGVRVMIGGGPMTEAVKLYTGADAWGTDAYTAVALCNEWIKEA
jgi:methanogenic corrinoid protein MtbC1